MKYEDKNIERKSWVAAAMGMTMTGMGQVYNGELYKGLGLFTISVVTFLAGLRLSVYLPDNYFLVAVSLVLVCVLTIYSFSIIEAYRKSSKQKTDYKLKFYNKWYFYLVVWMLGSLFITGAANNYIRNTVMQVFKVAAESMEPGVLKGDRIIADKTAYKRSSPVKGDIIVFVYPDDRRKIFLKRIAGLPGDIIKLEDGQEYTVPHGTVYVLGDNRQNSIDSRNFGPVPLRDVIGKVRQVWYSSGDGEVRWNRVGLTLGSFKTKTVKLKSQILQSFQPVLQGYGEGDHRFDTLRT